jgi:hypothetical protein
VAETEIERAHGRMTDQYVRVSENLSRNIVSLSMTVVATTWLVVEKGLIKDQRVALATFFLAIAAVALRVVSEVFGAIHLEQYFDGKIDLEHAGREYTRAGRWNGRLFWASLVVAGLGMLGMTMLLVLAINH